MTTVKKKDYASFNLPKDLIEDIKILKTAFEATTGKRTSYEEIIKGMMSDLQGSSPDVYAMFERIKESRDGLQTAGGGR